ncbi:MAG: lactonase family protein, partial [Gemmataceae bacterium]
MFPRLLLISLIGLFSSVAKADTFVYVSLDAEKRIAVYHLDPTTGKLTHRSDCPVAAGEPGGLAMDPMKRFLFAAVRSTNKLSSFRVDAKTGGLTPINTVSVGPNPAHLLTDHSGRFLLTAFYDDAKVTVHSIDEQGRLSEKPNQSLSTADKAHAIVPDSSNRYVFVPHTGPNVIFQFLWDARTGLLTANRPAKLNTPAGMGPRHLAWHPQKPVAYIDNEQGSSLTSYALDEKTGTLKSLHTASSIPTEFRQSNSTAEVKVHPTGRFAYVSNRGHDSIARFALEDQGRLKILGQTPTEK